MLHICLCYVIMCANLIIVTYVFVARSKVACCRHAIGQTAGSEPAGRWHDLINPQYYILLHTYRGICHRQVCIFKKLFNRELTLKINPKHGIISSPYNQQFLSKCQNVHFQT